MSPAVVAVLVGLATLWVTFKVLKLAIKFALLSAIGAAAFAAYTTYVAT